MKLNPKYTLRDLRDPANSEKMNTNKQQIHYEMIQQRIWGL